MFSANLKLHPDFTIGTVERRLFGGFVEQMGRHIYGGVYEPGHPTAGPDGFRRDVVGLVRELGITAVRYPGGNFVSGHDWEDGVGPVAERPRRLDLAWHSLEPNEVGLHEFSDWLDLVGADLVLAANLGTRGTREALHLLEYANVPGGTARADARRKNGREEPFDVRMWCLGNELDGDWQIGQKSADDYGKLAAVTARAMRAVDADLELAACGSSWRGMPTFGVWERTVLEHAYDQIDYISCHSYYHEEDGDTASFLASGVDMEDCIESVVHTIEHVRAVKRSKRRIDIAFDEWNIWYQDPSEIDVTSWPVAPRLLENQYSATDAVALGGLLITLLKHADRVKSANLAQLVNVIAPIMTEPGGPAWRQATFHPFAATARHARGTALRGVLDAPAVSTAKFGDVPAVDAVATLDGGRAAVFVLNRSLEDTASFTVDATALGLTGPIRAQGIWDEDRHAKNTLEAPDRVALRENPTARFADGTVAVELPPLSWTCVTVGGER
ncbi:alpha-N-arabinofuranosidase [Glycomyces sp. NPDC047369]